MSDHQKREAEYLAVLEQHGGALAMGAHTPSDRCRVCVLELASLVRLDEMTDNPNAVGLPDIRKINDAYCDGRRRTDALIPWLVALEGWAEWPKADRVAWAQRVTLRTVREVLPIALRAEKLDEHAQACEAAEDLASAKAAAGTAAGTAARDASWAASWAVASAASSAAAWAASSASSAAWAAWSVTSDDVLDLAVRIQIEEAGKIVES